MGINMREKEVLKMGRLSITIERELREECNMFIKQHKDIKSINQLIRHALIYYMEKEKRECNYTLSKKD